VVRRVIKKHCAKLENSKMNFNSVLIAVHFDHFYYSRRNSVKNGNLSAEPATDK
jgi:hypothetical protein